MKSLLAYLAGLVTPFALGGIVLASGWFDMSAKREPGSIERSLSGAALNRSLWRNAQKNKTAPAATPELLREGLTHYSEHCVPCHGAPGVDKGAIGKALNPPPPGLEQATTQQRTDGELYWMVAHGIRMTGMPAFAPSHEDKELWGLVTFIRHLSALTVDERRALAEAVQGEAGHHRARAEPEKPLAPGQLTKKPAHKHRSGAPPHQHQ